MTPDQQFLTFIIQSIVDNPDDVSIERTCDEMGVFLLLTVNPKDAGRVIGVEGATAKAIRTLLKVFGMKHNSRISLKIL